MTIEFDGRDKGKIFRIQEMPAADADDWALRAMTAMGRSNADISGEILRSGMMGFALMCVKAFVAAKYEDVRPLWTEMMQCVKFLPDPSNPKIVRELWPDDIEEVRTRWYLRQEVLELHTGFSNAALNLIFSAAREAMKEPVISPDMKTFDMPSEQSSGTV